MEFSWDNMCKIRMGISALDLHQLDDATTYTFSREANWNSGVTTEAGIEGRYWNTSKVSLPFTDEDDYP
ncbi:hypothetical protein Pyn_13545 [Prunus yedoensis var. nudiflora]|uniref:Uncharacterized protein n=1 Tax=Prunus yedoensis var. nudiflora TaxID=2094558 RepID=A0A314YE56_PRUYE|nr:hypothetical protein Pyn_13545 [Prunus yedoensis var. nudiflora]